MPRFRPEALKDLLEEAGVSPVGQTRRSLIYTCPRCGKPKLAFLKESGYAQCWKCADDGLKGWPEVAVAELLRINLHEARELLYGRGEPLRSTLDLPPPFGPAVEEDEGLPLMRWPDHAFLLSDPRSKRARAYLEGRGISVELAQEYGIRYSQEWRRVLIPVMVSGMLVGWQARSVVTGQEADARNFIKVKSSDDLPRGRVLMFEHRLVGAKHAVLTEGPFDGLKAHEAGGNVATMGKEVTDAQLDVIERHGITEVIDALDPDAWRARMKLAERCWRRGWTYRAAEIPTEFKDLGEMALGDAGRCVLNAPAPTRTDLPKMMFEMLEGDKRWKTS